ncbi:hypothetical protein QTP88_019805 [Uroleucon formosanum]
MLENIEKDYNNPREFFKKCRTVRQDFKAQTFIIKDDNDDILTEPTKIVEKFRLHFELLNNNGNFDKYKELIYQTVEPELAEPDLEEIDLIIKEVSTSFECKTGLRQGDALSPVLFNLALEKVARSATDTEEMDVIGTHTLLAYADDIIILGKSKLDVEERARKLINSSSSMGLVINENKTKYMVMTRNAMTKSNLHVGDLTFEQVEDFKYLGVNINEKNNMHNEIRMRINAANRCYFTMREMFFSKILSRRTKERLYCTYMRPVVTYACETWSSTQGDEEKLQNFERKILRKIYGPVYNNELEKFERRKNENLQQLYNKPSIRHFLIRKRLEWAGLVWRAEDTLIKKVTESKITGKRPRGRTRQRWYDRVEKYLKKINPLLDMGVASDREKWKGILEAAMVLNGPL